MRKKILKRMTALSVALLVISAQSIPLFAGDTWPYKDEAAHGTNEPSVHGYTSQQVADWDYESDPDAQLLRSFIPLQERIDAYSATQANPSLSAEAGVINVAGDYGNAFIENSPYTNKFAQYHFTFWQYVDAYAYWHGTATSYMDPDLYDDLAQSDWTQKWFEFGILNIPNPTWTDAAHKNGVMSLATIFFSNGDRGMQTYKQMLVKDEDGTFPVAEKLIAMAEYFGYDGYFFNQEESNPNVEAEDIADYKAFLARLEEAGLYINWYDAVNSETGATEYLEYFADSNIDFLYDRETGTEVTDSFFMNYWWNPTKLQNTINYLDNLNNLFSTDYSIFDVAYYGIEAGAYRFDKSLGSQSHYNSKVSDLLDENGTQLTSLAMLGADFVHAGLDEDMDLSWPNDNRHDNDYQWMTTVREQLWWSGPNQDPTDTDTTNAQKVNDVYATPTTGTNSWPGVASVIAERSVVGDSNFYTNFNTGHGLRWYQDGEVNNDSEWSNIAIQDILVTWQWWQESNDSEMTVDFDYGTGCALDGTRYSYEQIGGYNGGSSLVVNGDLAANDSNFLRLYKTEIDVANSGQTFSMTYYKSSDDDTSSIKLGLILQSDPDTVIEVELVNNGSKADGWETISVDLSKDYAGQTIAAFGLIFDNSDGEETIVDYQVNIGNITISDGAATKASAPTGLSIQEAFDSTNEEYVSEMYLQWDLNSDYSEVKQYNIYVNDTWVGAKYDSVYYIKNLPATSGTIKVVPVGADGKEGEAASISFNLDVMKVTNITTKSSEDGSFIVNWDVGEGAFGNVTVEVESINILSGDPVIESQTVSIYDGSVTFTDMPINGDDFIVRISKAGCDTLSVTGTFIDKVVEPYDEDWYWEGDTLYLPMLTSKDWKIVHVYEDGVEKQFTVTYLNTDYDGIIRGRTNKSCLSFTSTASTVYVTVEDYAGNISEPVYLRGSEADAASSQ